jgi:hypothetical protein
MSSNLNHVADAGKTVPDIESSYDAESRLPGASQWTEFDLIITADCGLEFGPPGLRNFEQNCFSS